MNAPMTMMLDKKRAKNYAEQQGLYAYEYPRPGVTADVVVYCKKLDSVLFIKRKNDPFKGHWALPGGFMEINETLVDAAMRELEEETGVALPCKPDFVDIYDAPDRDPRGRTISAVYLAVFNEAPYVKAADDAEEFTWLNPSQLNGFDIAFDHKWIIRHAMNYYNHNFT